MLLCFASHLIFFVVDYANKRKKLIPGGKVKDGVQRLEIQCKDFRIVSFNFKLTLKGTEKAVSSIFQYSHTVLFPNQLIVL